MRQALLLLFISVFACKDTPPAPAHAPSARELVASGAVVLDVRTPDEYAEDHLANATNVPIDDLAARIADVDTLVRGDRAKPIVVYCSAGSRAARAKTELEAAGFKRVTNGGGLDDLR